MLRPGFWIVLLGVLAAGSALRAQPASAPAACPPFGDYAIPDEPLSHVAAVLAAGGTLNVLAIGSATTVGVSASMVHGTAPGGSYPYRMADALQAARPHLQLGLTVRGGRGMTAESMLPLLRQALKAQRYQLVLWQTSTVEAVHGDSPDAMQSALEDGAEQVLDSGADLVLVDSQFSRFLRANVDLDPYQSALQQVAAMPGVVVFRRFDLMRDWAHEGQLDLERAGRVDRPREIARLNTCLGQALARFVLNGAAQK
ncbi:MAG TPA: hypothetical protein VFN42_02685 [Acetobacteraceae bacterium]|nr:hypothetical protein [Acetobacteraceae bacterium]